MVPAVEQGGGYVIAWGCTAVSGGNLVCDLTVHILSKYEANACDRMTFHVFTDILI